MENDKVILINNLFNGSYLDTQVGGEIINIYLSDNGHHYIYVNPYGNISSTWNDRIGSILFIRSVGGKMVKVIGKATGLQQIAKDIKHKTGNNVKIAQSQLEYIEKNNIKYAGIPLNKLGSWSNVCFTFKADSVNMACKDIYLTTEGEDIITDNYICLSLKNIQRINNQSQKLYIEEKDVNYERLTKIIDNDSFWEASPVGKIDVNKIDDHSLKISFL